MSYVYVIESADAVVKIGHSKAPRRRIHELQTSASTKLRAECIVRCANSRAIERQVHARLKPCRLKGEWFKCHPALAAFVVRVCAGQDPRTSLADDLLMAFGHGRAPDWDSEDVMHAVHRAYLADPALLYLIDAWAEVNVMHLGTAAAA